MSSVVESRNEVESLGLSHAREEIVTDASVHWSLLLWERRRFVGRLSVAGILLSLVVVFLIPKSFESTTRLMPPDQSGSGLGMLAAMTAGSSGGAGSALGNVGGLAGLGALAGQLLGVKNTGEVFVDILHSRTVQYAIVNRFDLRKVYGRKLWETARKQLNNRTDITQDRKSGVITIAVADRDPRRAQQIAQAYVEELDRVVAQVSTSSARRERIFVEQRLQTAKRDLDAASKSFGEYASQNTMLDITDQSKAMVEGAAALEGQLIAAESELQGLAQIYTSNNVRIRSLQARITELKNQLAKIGGSSNLNSDKSAAPDELYPPIRKLPLLGIRWVDLYREVKIQETVYELLTQEYEMAKIEEAKEIPTVKVLDPADVPERKSFPPRTILLLLGVVLSLLLSMLCVIAADAWRKTDPGHPMKQLAEEITSFMRRDAPRLYGLMIRARSLLEFLG